MGEAVTDGPGAWGTLVGSAGRTRSSPVAQLAEHATVNRRVSGSSPLGGAKSPGQRLMRVLRPLAVLTVCQSVCHRTHCYLNRMATVRGRGDSCFALRGFSGLAA